MAPYAASIIRIFLKEKKNKNSYKKYFKKKKLVKSFYIIAKCQKK